MYAKNILIKYNITCAIFIVSVRPRLLFDLLKKKKRFQFAMTVKQIIFGRILFAFTKELGYLAEKNDFLHFTVNVPYGRRKKKKKKSSLWSLTGISGTSSHHCQPLNVLVPSFWYFPSPFVLYVEISTSQRSWLKLPFLT